jgi:hypothetical protein
MILLYILLGIAILPMWALGTFVFIQVCRPAKAPADASNIINRIRLLWFALTRHELFAEWFEWVKHDELDNVRKKG